MLNLSDKELDRLARQAANEYDPGGLPGRGQWDQLEAGLNKELGRPRPNLFRAIRRMPFYYAPAVLLLLGASYYFIRNGKSNPRHDTPVPTSPVTAKTEPSGGSPPLAIVRALPQRPGQTDNDASANTKKIQYKATSTPRKETETENKGLIRDNAASPGGNGANVSSASSSSPSPSFSAPSSSGSFNTHHPGHRDISQHGHPADIVNNGRPSGSTAKMTKSHVPGHYATAGVNEEAKPNTAPGGKDVANKAHVNAAHGLSVAKDLELKELAASKDAAPTKDAALSVVHEPVMHAQRPVVDDAGLRGIASRAAAKKSGPITLGKSHSPSLHIDRPLQIGFSIAPDFASVNDLAGDRPGSSFGLTLDYQIVNKLYIGTGFLYSRKNYTATAQDYHVPFGYYQMNNMHEVDFVKGSFEFMEIPLNLRYDFSVAGNTSFFASGGMSSYFLTRENCNYFYQLFGRETSRGFNYQNNGTHLFSSVNLSIGVETGLSNDFSLLVAPYVKLPSSGIGFGQVEMSSVGINIALKYAPVLRRTRHR
jgi:hypothetical protein